MDALLDSHDFTCAYGNSNSKHQLKRKIVKASSRTSTPLMHLVILQIYRVSDMELVRVLPSAEDEVNVACFHPLVGGGLVYGTKVKRT